MEYSYYHGGGIYIESDATFIMKGNATVHDNISEHGGGLYQGAGTFTIQDSASVYHNTATNGGGIYIDASCTMKGNVAIHNNTAKQGGGVHLGNNGMGTFTMQENASIYGNTAGSGRGGGIYNPGTFRIEGGTINGANADTDANTASEGASLYNLKTAQYGNLNGSVWTSNGYLSTTNNTIKVINGNLQALPQFTVSFESNGGSTVEPISVELGNTVGQPANPTKTGNTFAGWYKEAGLINPWNFATDTVSQYITLYAKWTLNSYTVSFNADGGAPVPQNQTLSYGATVSKPGVDPAKPGYTFGGWYKESACTNVWNFDTDTVSGPTTIYAKWIINQYTVSFESNGGSTVGSQTVNYLGTATRPPDPVKASAGFVDWYSDEGLRTPYNFGSQVTGNVTLYAKWLDDIAVSFNNLTANGSITQSTTILTLTFSQDIAELSAADITFAEGTTGVIKGVLTRIDTGVYELGVSGITASGQVTLGVNKSGYIITPASKDVTVFFYGILVNFTDLSADGGNFVTTSKLILSFDQDIPGLNASDITFSPGVSGGIKGSLSSLGSGVYELEIYGIYNGSPSIAVSVTINKPGYTISPSSRSVYVYNAIPIYFDSVGANGSATATTTIISIYLDDYIQGLGAWHITLGGSTGATKNNSSLRHMGIARPGHYELDVTGITQSGTVTVTIENVPLYTTAGYVISPSSRNVQVYYYAEPVSFDSISADGSSTSTTSKLTLYFNKDITGLNANDITLSSDTGAVKGELTRINTGVYELGVSGINASGEISVSVNKLGYNISGNPKQVQVNYFSPQCIVSFVSNGGSTVPNQTIEYGTTVVKPTDPTRDGYTFGGWYTDDNTFINAYNFSTPVATNVNLYAKWDIITLTKIEITAYPVKTIYYVGESLDLFGLVVTAAYNDGSSKTVSSYSTSGFSSSTPGSKTVTINYTESTISKSTSFTITVNPVATWAVTLNDSAALTTSLTFTFSEVQNDLIAADISITAGTGAGEKGTLTGSGTMWTLNITTLKDGEISLAFVKPSIEAGTKTVFLNRKFPNWNLVEGGTGAGQSKFPSTNTSVIHDIVWGGPAGQEKFIAIGSTTDVEMAYSSDGRIWTGIQGGSGAGRTQFPAYADVGMYQTGYLGIFAIIWGGPTGQRKFVAVGERGYMSYSPDGINWTGIPAGTGSGKSQFTENINCITWGGNAGQEKFIAAGANGQMAYSADGINWTSMTNMENIWEYEFWVGSLLSSRNTNIMDIIWGGPTGQKKFVAVGTFGRMAYSSNGTNWTAIPSGNNSGQSQFTNDIASITWGGFPGQEKFIAGDSSSNPGAAGYMAYSSNGINWTTIPPGTGSGRTQLTENIGSIYWGGSPGMEKFIAGENGKIAYSSDGLNWVLLPAGSELGQTMLPGSMTGHISGITWGGSAGQKKYIAVSMYGRIIFSPDGQ